MKISMDSLMILFDNEPEYNLKAEKYANLFLKRAKMNRDNLQIANGYHIHSNFYHDSIGLKYEDSAYRYVKKVLPLNQLHLEILRNKATYAHRLGRFKVSLEAALLVKKIADSTNNVEYQIRVKELLASYKNATGNFKEALELQKDYIDNLDVLFSGKKYRYHYARSLHNLLNDYIRVGEIDSAYLCAVKGINLTLPDSSLVDRYHKFLASSGYIHYFKGNYISSIDSLNKAEPVASIKTLSLQMCHYYRGHAYQNLGDTLTGVNYFKKVDSLFQLTQDPFPELRSTYTELRQYYKKKGDLEKQLEYLDKFVYADSLLNSDAAYISKRLTEEYDKPKLLAEKQEIIDTLDARRKRLQLSNILLNGSLTLVAGFLVFFYARQRTYKKRYEHLISNGQATAKAAIKKPKQEALGMKPALVEKLLAALERFENERLYLNSNLTLAKAAAQLDTNSTYLSKVVNHYKQQNFSSYLNQLRIDHAIKALQEDPKLRKYSIKGIAEEMGYANPESFSKAFRQRTGIFPSYYIKQLEKTTEKVLQ